MATKIHISLKKEADDSYDIVIGTTLTDAARDILRFVPGDRYFAITDSNVKRFYGTKFARLMKRTGVDCPLLSVPAGEKSKSRATKGQLEDKLLSLGAVRSSVIIALGGGMVGDLAGFVASTLLRGIRYVHIPTTLLAQVDSSIGGKVAVNHPLGKNLLGAFCQPKRVCIDISTLGTLPDREFVNGMAEVIKFAAILDRDLFSYLEVHSEKILTRDTKALIKVITRCCELKRNVVEIDEKETSYRRILNFGHTIGHALESLSGYRLPHGMAVAIGMAAEARISVARGLLTAGAVARLENLLHAYRLPTKIPSSTDITELCEATRTDKKARDGRVHYTLLQRIGKARTDMRLSHDAVRRILS
ncbi:MAG: 3-dehydroquinate synthase [Bacteroidota bacterium]|jgi:3-dehydroquinate synthase